MLADTSVLVPVWLVWHCVREKRDELFVMAVVKGAVAGEKMSKKYVFIV